MIVLRFILVVLSFLAGVYCVHRLRRLDIHEKEPFWKMAATTVLGGVASISLAMLLYLLLSCTPAHALSGTKVYFLFVGFVEESTKLAALLLCWPIIRKELNEPTDGLIYMACTAMGFSLIENYFYAARAPGTAWLIALRLLICTPMHISFSLLMGLAFYRAVKEKAGWGALGAAWLFGSLYHAFYDVVVSIPLLLPTMYLFVIGAYRWMFRVLGYTTARSPFRLNFRDWLAASKPAETEPADCLACGCTGPQTIHRLGRIRLGQCPACGAVQCSQTALCHMVHHFGSAFGSLRKASRDWNKLRVLVDSENIDEKNGVACFRPEELHPQLEALSEKQVAWMESRWWYRKRN